MQNQALKKISKNEEISELNIRWHYLHMKTRNRRH